MDVGTLVVAWAAIALVSVALTVLLAFGLVSPQFS